ncbi:unnamed protein product, partial [Chrysoparadoxa australica]
MMLPLWLDKEEDVLAMAETIASSNWHTSLLPQDLLQSMLFYVALGKEDTLRQLSRVDALKARSGQSGDNATQGTRAAGENLLKLLGHDLRTAHGRSVAEKNAYVLLRKRQYLAGIAVFLLPRPAFLSEALQVIMAHLKDPALALLVARLIERRDAGVHAGAALRLLKQEILPYFDGERSDGHADAFLEAAALLHLGQPAHALAAVCSSKVVASPVLHLDTEPGREVRRALQTIECALNNMTRPLLLEALASLAASLGGTDEDSHKLEGMRS